MNFTPEEILQKLTYSFTIFMFGVLLLETIGTIIEFKKRYKKELVVNYTTGVFSLLTVGLIKTFIITKLLFIVYEYRIFDLSLKWHVWIGAFLAYTFYDYVSHMLYHRVRILWCFHATHHSVQYMHSSAGFRVSVLNIFSAHSLLLLLPLFGLHPITYFLVYTLAKFWGVVLHINEKHVGKIGWLGYILVSPSAHQVHHGSNKIYIDKNYGEVVPWFDMLFGTYAIETEKPNYGTAYATEELGFWDSQLFEFRRLKKDLKQESSWKEKMKIMLYPPSYMEQREVAAKIEMVVN